MNRLKDNRVKDMLSRTNDSGYRMTVSLLANADVLSFHDYRSLHQTIERVGTLKPFGRPILCTEYLARGEGSRFESHLPYFKENKIGTYNWGLVAGRIQTQYPWSSWQKELTAEPEVWHHDILRSDGTPHLNSEAEFIKAITTGRNPPQPAGKP
jgi:hypothetical protein